MQRYFHSLNYLLLIGSGEPGCYEKFILVEDLKEWEHAMDEEMQSFISNQIWDLARLLDDKRELDNK